MLDEVRLSNLLIIPKGGVAWATVTEAQSKRRMARGGKLDMNIDSVRLIDGEKVALRAVKEVKGGGHTGAMTGAMVGTAIVFFPAAPLFLFMHGKDITIPKGTEITAYVNGNFPIDPTKFQPKTATNTVQANSKLAISSVPDGADIEVDGSFVGNTPSVIELASGDHSVLVKKPGYSCTFVCQLCARVRIHSARERTCCTISTKTFRVSAGLLTSRKNAMRAPRMPS